MKITPASDVDHCSE